MSADAHTSPNFAPVAQRVASWLLFRRWVHGLGRTLWAAVALVGLGLILAAWTGHALYPVLLWCVMGLWLLVPLGLVLWRRPGHYSNLALWDQATGRREAFASAWWFEQQPALTAAQSAHVATQSALLPQALPALRRDLPLQPHRWLWLPLALAVLGLFIGQVLHPAAEIVTLDAEMEQMAKKEADRLAQADWDKKKLEGLSAEEQAALEKLTQSLKQTSSDLEKAGGKDAREVMASLEQRAREAEKLAERLDADKDIWASDKLIQSMREHADTADLGDAVAAKDATQSAAAAENLAQKLQSPQLTSDARERLNETLKDTEQQSEKEDRQRPVGQHLLSAGDRLKQAQSAEAGAEFQKLADKMRDLARREKSKEELEKLAQQIRDAGSNITGKNQAGGMQQMAAAEQAGKDGQSSQQAAPQVGQTQPNAGQMGKMGQASQAQSSLQPPGLGQNGQPQQMLQQAQTPGSGETQKMQLSQMSEGAQPGKEGQPMLVAPIPGQKPGEKPDAIVLGPPGDNPAQGPGMVFSVPNGKEAGAGVAELNAEATEKQNTANQAVVNAQQTNEGQSSVRAIEGGVRQEKATRSASQIATDAISAEEAALDESPLPPARREQVRRYFTELRKRFEK
jgi:hypothetical protein